MNFKIMKLNMMRKKPLNLDDFAEYEQQIFERIRERKGIRES